MDSLGLKILSYGYGHREAGGTDVTALLMLNSLESP